MILHSITQFYVWTLPIVNTLLSNVFCLCISYCLIYSCTTCNYFPCRFFISVHQSSLSYLSTDKYVSLSGDWLDFYFWLKFSLNSFFLYLCLKLKIATSGWRLISRFGEYWEWKIWCHTVCVYVFKKTVVSISSTLKKNYKEGDFPFRT